MTYHINALCEDGADRQLENGEWVRARPDNWRFASITERLRDAWLVLTGRADAVVWTGQ